MQMIWTSCTPWNASIQGLLGVHYAVWCSSQDAQLYSFQLSVVVKLWQTGVSQQAHFKQFLFRWTWKPQSSKHCAGATAHRTHHHFLSGALEDGGPSCQNKHCQHCNYSSAQLQASLQSLSGMITCCYWCYEGRGSQMEDILIIALADKVLTCVNQSKLISQALLGLTRASVCKCWPFH